MVRGHGLSGVVEIEKFEEDDYNLKVTWRTTAYTTHHALMNMERIAKYKAENFRDISLVLALTFSNLSSGKITGSKIAIRRQSEQPSRPLRLGIGRRTRQKTHPD
jgi:hypothetical protein